MTPKFSNLLNYRINATELILQFGALFPTPEGPNHAPVDTDFHTTIVMGADIIEPFIAGLQEMKKARDLARRNVKQTNESADKAEQGRQS